MTVVLLLFVLGVVIGRRRSTPASAVEVLDWFVIRVSLPALIFDRMRDLEIGAEALVPVAMAWVSGALVALVVMIVARRNRWDRGVTGSVLLCATLGNTSFLGFPATTALLGADHLPAAIVFDQLGSFLALATWGTYVSVRFGQGEVATPASVAIRVATFPPFCALCLAGALNFVQVPAGILNPVGDAAAMIGATVTPLAIVAVGMRVHVPSVTSIQPTAVGIILKMVFAPAVVLALAWLAAADGIAWDASVLQAAAPPMVTASVVAYESGLDASVATAMTSMGLIVAFGTLPLVAWIVS